jgi:hypothetical protein
VDLTTSNADRRPASAERCTEVSPRSLRPLRDVVVDTRLTL